MPTIKQLIRNTRQPIRNVTKSPALGGCPQRRGTCTRVYVRLVQISDCGLGQKKKFFHYPWSVPMNRIEWKTPLDYLKWKKKRSRICFYCVSNLWFLLVQIQLPQFSIENAKEFPIGSKWLSVKQGKSYLN